jgi:hypothetical protein
MDLIYGLLLIVLIPFTIFLTQVMKIIPVEYWIGILAIMLFGDGVLTFSWVYGFLGMVDSRELFVSGLGISFFLNMILKIYLVLKVSGLTEIKDNEICLEN